MRVLAVDVFKECKAGYIHHVYKKKWISMIKLFK
tara:strand:- start:58 stop:159 length:102 start_codon:yes stop_codon:yes gene_type:complete